jgi:hypothetical protein
MYVDTWLDEINRNANQEVRLLPSVEYGMGWLKVRDGQNLMSVPVADPYAEVYLQRGKWWSLIDDKLMNPLDPEKKTIDADWEAYENMIIKKLGHFTEIFAGNFITRPMYFTVTTLCIKHGETSYGEDDCLPAGCLKHNFLRWRI